MRFCVVTATSVKMDLKGCRLGSSDVFYGVMTWSYEIINKPSGFIIGEEYLEQPGSMTWKNSAVWSVKF